MKAHRTGVLIVSALLAVGLGACGGSGSGSSSSSDTTAPDTTATTSTPTPEKASAGGGLTAPGTTLKFGETATVGWVLPSEYDSTVAQEGTKLKVTVDSIEKGSIDDFANVELEPAEKESTPYYMHVTVESLEEIPSTAEDDPILSVMAIDDRGQEQGKVSFFGEFSTCPETETPSPFKAGESYESCLTYLMPGGGSIAEAQWNSGPSPKEGVTPYLEKPVLWTATGS